MVTRLRILVCIFVGILGGYTFFPMLLENRMLRHETRAEVQWPTDITVPTTSTRTDVPVILGKINPKRKYAVFSTTSTTSDAHSLGFIFQLPLTTLAWRRIGFNSVIIIVGSESGWNSDPLLYMVLTNVLKFDAVVIFLNAHPMNAIMVSQVGITAFLKLTVHLPSHHGSAGTVIVVTSEVNGEYFLVLLALGPLELFSKLHS